MADDCVSVIKVLGKGAFGKTVLIKNTITDQMYAQKVINLEDISADDKALAYKEASLLSSLNHPNVVRFYWAYIFEKKLHIVMEYCPNGNLRQYMNARKGMIDEQMLFHIIKNLCKGLQYLHSKNVFHRDIKPENIFLGENMTIKIGDFGLAKSLTQSFVKTSMAGTCAYMAPEQILMKPYTMSCDIWALGTMIYELITRLHPFLPKFSTEGMNENILNCRYTPISELRKDVCPVFENIVKMCLIKNHEERANIKAIIRLVKEKGKEMERNAPIKIGAKIYRPETAQVLILSIY